MYSKNVLRAVGPIAQTHTAGNKLLVVAGEHLPLAAACESYNNYAEPNNVDFSHDVAADSEQTFVKQNAVASDIQQATFDNQVDNVSTGLKAAIAQTRGVIVPAVRHLVKEYNLRQAAQVSPEIRLDVVKYDAVHSEPALVNHVQARYNAITVRPEYKSFRLGDKNVESIIEMVAVNNPHLDQVRATEWLLKMGAERIAAVWAMLFKNSTIVTPGQIGWVQLGASPETSDEVLLAYCLCGHLVDNPIDPVDENASLEEWNLNMQLLHQFFGAMLLRAYTRRVQHVQRGILVLSPKVNDPIANLSVVVKVNGDLYEKALEQGITLEGLLGSVCYQHQVAITDLLESNDRMAKNWQRLYPVMRQAAMDRTIANRRREVTKLMSEPVPGVQLPVADAAAFSENLRLAVAQLSEADYNSPFDLFGKLVTKVYFDNPIYPAFMEAFARYSRIYPDATPRELAFFGLIEITALWLSQQVQVQDFTPVVDPNAVLPTVSMEQEGEEPLAPELDEDGNPIVKEEGDALDEHEEEEEQASKDEISEAKQSEQGQLDQAILDRRDGIEPEPQPGTAESETDDGEPLTGDATITAKSVDENGQPVTA